MHYSDTLRDSPVVCLASNRSCRPCGTACSASGLATASRCSKDACFPSHHAGLGVDFLSQLSRLASECLVAHASGCRGVHERLIDALSQVLQANSGDGALAGEDAEATAAFLIGGTRRLVHNAMGAESVPACLVPAIVDLWRRMIPTPAITA